MDPGFSGQGVAEAAGNPYQIHNLETVAEEEGLDHFSCWDTQGLRKRLLTLSLRALLFLKKQLQFGANFHTRATP